MKVINAATESSGSSGPVGEVGSENNQPDYSGINNDMFRSTAGELPTNTPPTNNDTKTEDTKSNESAPQALERQDDEKIVNPVAPVKKDLVIPEVGKKTEEDSGEPIKQVNGSENATEKKPVGRPSGRDYTGYDPEHVEILKKLGNREFNIVAKILKEQTYPTREKTKELESALQIHNVEKDFLNPEGYQLSPEYAGISNAIENLDTEVNYWKDQLRNAKAGRPVHGLKLKGDLTSKSAEYFQGQPLSKEDGEATAIDNLQAARARKEQLTGIRDNFKTQYIQRNQGFLSEAKQAADKYFPNLVNPPENIKQQLQTIQTSLGPHGMGFSGPLLTRAVYSLGVAAERFIEMEKENAKLKKQLESNKRASPLAISGDDEGGDRQQLSDPYAGVKNSDFRDY